jgi:hypothetical protein
MYANLGPGMQLSPTPPSAGPTLMYSDQYVANRVSQTNLCAYADNNPVNAVDPSGLLVGATEGCALLCAGATAPVTVPVGVTVGACVATGACAYTVGQTCVRPVCERIFDWWYCEGQDPCQDDYAKCLLTKLADRKGRVSGEKACYSCYRWCKTQGGWVARTGYGLRCDYWNFRRR